jgi:hypothetical protein
MHGVLDTHTAQASAPPTLLPYSWQPCKHTALGRVTQCSLTWMWRMQTRRALVL